VRIVRAAAGGVRHDATIAAAQSRVEHGRLDAHLLDVVAGGRAGDGAALARHDDAGAVDGDFVVAEASAAAVDAETLLGAVGEAAAAALDTRGETQHAEGIAVREVEGIEEAAVDDVGDVGIGGFE
jgi:hypothetical protein